MDNINYDIDYFEWLIESFTRDRGHDPQNYYDLLENLYLEDFYWLVERDESRAQDGLDLRYIYCDEHNLDISAVTEVGNHLDGICSVLEMMIGLACRIENEIMHEDDYGDRTAEWFWRMVESIGLDDMDNRHFNPDKFDYAIGRMLERRYDRDGRGGLFYIPGTEKDLRKAEIWYQMSWYLNAIFPISYD